MFCSKIYVSSSFPNSWVKYTTKQVSEAAPSSARVASYMANPQIFGFPPLSIEHIITNEMT